ncbi:MAG: hypothetical protein R2758_15865 [Bacteroidales bacterium]
MGDAEDSTGEPPDGWRQTLESFRNITLQRYREHDGCFGLGEQSANIAYISSFRIFVLAWSGRHSSDISAL